MKTAERVFLTVLDSLGAGEAPDAADFGDVGSNTLKSISKSKEFDIPNLRSLGLGNIDGLDFLGAVDCPGAVYSKLRELSRGKDTTTGHWEIAGLVSKFPMPTYPHGFPDDIIAQFVNATGRGVLCNLPYSGTQVIKDFGAEHLKAGKLIVYTSGDSVFQIAAHKSIVSVEKLYEYCRAARDILNGENAVGRVIARPFDGEYPDFFRTDERRDFSLEPPDITLNDTLKAAGFDVISVGKISDIFAARGITKALEAHNNEQSMEQTDRALDMDFHGLCFINLVDFDSKYGHRNDVDGYARALTEYDRRLPQYFAKLRDGDIFMITADHGCDPATESTDHSREYTPLLIYGKNIKPRNLGIKSGFFNIATTVAALLGVKATFPAQGEVLCSYDD